MQKQNVNRASVFLAGLGLFALTPSTKAGSQIFTDATLDSLRTQPQSSTRSWLGLLGGWTLGDLEAKHIDVTLHPKHGVIKVPEHGNQRRYIFTVAAGPNSYLSVPKLPDNTTIVVNGSGYLKIGHFGRFVTLEANHYRVDYKSSDGLCFSLDIRAEALTKNGRPVKPSDGFDLEFAVPYNRDEMIKTHRPVNNGSTFKQKHSAKVTRPSM